MTLPIISYGHGILRQKSKEIDSNYPQLSQLISDMWETLYIADGTGLAAPQVNHSIKLFIVDSKQIYAKMEEDEREEFFENNCGIKEVFINANIVEYSENFWIEQEGCLSIPSLSENVKRSWTITIEYLNPNFEKQMKTFSGITAKVIQHEYDHTLGKLYIDHINPLKRKLLNRKLVSISKGKVETKYKMK